MVRVGGGWDTLQNYLDKHDPCRCRRGELPPPPPPSNPFCAQATDPPLELLCLSGPTRVRWQWV